MADLVQCKDCGYLAIIQYRPRRELIEVDREIRDTGHVPDPTPELAYIPHPLCFVRRWDLAKEIKQVKEPGMPERPADFLAVFEKRRDCGDAYCRWNQGFSPKEHYEMIQERDRLAWQGV